MQPFAQDHRGDVHRDLVDQPRRERLPADVAGSHADEPVARELPGEPTSAVTDPAAPRTRPDRAIADKAYSHLSTRAALRERRIPFTSPERRDQVNHRRAKGSAGGRPPAFDQVISASRNVVECCFNRLRQFRDLATRYAKRAAYYRAEIIIASIVLRLRTDLQDTT